MAEKGKAVKVYSLTPFGEEMAKIAKDFEQRIRIDTLEDLRVMVISKIEETEPLIDAIEARRAKATKGRSPPLFPRMDSTSELRQLSALSGVLPDPSSATATFNVTPEPSSLIVALTGSPVLLAGLVLRRRRRPLVP